MEKNNNDTFKKVSVSSMLTYFRGLSIENQENVLRWAKASKNPSANINTNNPSEWEKKMKSLFSQLNLDDQAEVISQASKIVNDKKARNVKK